MVVVVVVVGLSPVGVNVASILFRIKVNVLYSHPAQYLETQTLSKPVQETTHTHTVDAQISTDISYLHVRCFIHLHMNPLGSDGEMRVCVHRSICLLCPH